MLAHEQTSPYLLRRDMRGKFSFELRARLYLRQGGEGLHSHSLCPSLRRQHARDNSAERALPKELFGVDDRQPIGIDCHRLRGSPFFDRVPQRHVRDERGVVQQGVCERRGGARLEPSSNGFVFIAVAVSSNDWTIHYVRVAGDGAKERVRNSRRHNVLERRSQFVGISGARSYSGRTSERA